MQFVILRKQINVYTDKYDINEFNDDNLNERLDKLSKENKTISLLGDFNINLLNCNDHPPINKDLDSLTSNSFTPNILQPTRILVTQKPSLMIDSLT